MPLRGACCPPDNDDVGARPALGRSSAFPHGKSLMFRFASLLAALILSACGGGSSSDGYQQAVDLANSTEADARSLGTDSPCGQAHDCGALAFLQPNAPCATWTYKPYSLVSATSSAASAAAAEQVSLANQARALAPPSGAACAAVVPPVPTLSCIASKCQVAL